MKKKNQTSSGSGMSQAKKYSATKTCEMDRCALVIISSKSYYSVESQDSKEDYSFLVYDRFERAMRGKNCEYYNNGKVKETGEQTKT